MADALEQLVKHERLFIEMGGKVVAIITRADLQKMPVRMWLFGLVSLTEMRMLRLICERIPEQEWHALIGGDSGNRIKKAQEIYQARRMRNQFIDLLECTEMCDKATIFIKDARLRSCLPWKSKCEAKRFFGRLEKLRNELAHGNEIPAQLWPDQWDLVRDCQILLDILERESARHTTQGSEATLPCDEQSLICPVTENLT